MARNNPEVVNEPPETCGHPDAVLHSYSSMDLEVQILTCPTCHAHLTETMDGVNKVAPHWQRHAHAVVGRAAEIQLTHKTQLRVLRALAKLSHELEHDEFILRWPEWCWDHFAEATGTALAFPTDSFPPGLVDAGRGGRRRK